MNRPGCSSIVKDFRKYLPQNTFDWIVVVVGFIAIIAGVILCVGLIGMALKKIFTEKKAASKNNARNLSANRYKKRLRIFVKIGGTGYRRSGHKDRFFAPKNKGRKHVAPL